MRMIASCTKLLLFGLVLLCFAGCTHSVLTPPQEAPTADPKPVGVTANSGGDTRGTILYQPDPSSASPPDPYAAVSRKIVLPQRQELAWMLAEIDIHAHQQAAKAYPVPDIGSPGYLSKSKSRDSAEQQASFNAYLLEKYHARFCNQFHVTYDQIALIIEESRDKSWPMPIVPKE